MSEFWSLGQTHNKLSTYELAYLRILHNWQIRNVLKLCEKERKNLEGLWHEIQHLRYVKTFRLVEGRFPNQRKK